jgi:hypoxia up-regulated 1
VTSKYRPTPAELVRVDVRDIGHAFVNLSDAEIASSQLKLTMRVDARGFVQAANAVVHIPTIPKEKESVMGKLKGLFGDSSNKEEAEKAEEALKNLEAELEELEKSTENEKKVALKFTETPLGIRPLSAETKKQARAR